MIKLIMYYHILELDNTATMNDVKKSYKKLAKKWHPDKHLGKSESELQEINNKFNKITTAYKNLIDDDKDRDKKELNSFKKEYDDVDNIYFNRLNIDESQNLVVEQSITVRDIYINRIFKISYNFKSRCIKCIGKGYINIDNPDTCMECGGFGRINNKKCNFCYGVGKYITNSNICPICLGNKYLTQISTIYYNYNNSIIKDRRDIKLQFKQTNNSYKIIGKGNESEFGTGNLVLNINLIRDNMYKIIDNNLYVNHQLLLSDALIGFCHELLLPDNSKIIIKNNNSIIKPNQNMLIENFGIEHNKIRGSLIIHFLIEFPTSISTDSKKIIKSIFPYKNIPLDITNNIVVSF